MSSMRCYDLPLRSRLLERTTTYYTKVRTGPSPLPYSYPQSGPMAPAGCVSSDQPCGHLRFPGVEPHVTSVADDGIPHQLYCCPDRGAQKHDRGQTLLSFYITNTIERRAGLHIGSTDCDPSSPSGAVRAAVDAEPNAAVVWLPPRGRSALRGFHPIPWAASSCFQPECSPASAAAVGLHWRLALRGCPRIPIRLKIHQRTDHRHLVRR